MILSAGGAITAGLLVTLQWTLPFYVNAGVAALGLPIVMSLPAVEENPEEVFTVGDAARTLGIQARRPELRWFVAYAALFYGVFQLVLAFEQIALREVGISLTGLGILYAGFKLVSAGAASQAGWVQDRFGARSVFKLFAPVIGLAFAGVALQPLLLLPVLFLNRGLNTLTRPVRNQYINGRFSGMGRATVLSGASMVRPSSPRPPTSSVASWPSRSGLSRCSSVLAWSRLASLASSGSRCHQYGRRLWIVRIRTRLWSSPTDRPPTD